MVPASVAHLDACQASGEEVLGLIPAGSGNIFLPEIHREIFSAVSSVDSRRVSTSFRHKNMHKNTS